MSSDNWAKKNDLELARGNAITLTPNRRLALFLQSKSKTSSKQTKQTETVENPSENETNETEKPDIFPLNVWLDQLYTSLTVKDPEQYPRRISAFEERIIWEKIVADSEVGQTLLRTSTAAGLAKKAWEICGQWQLFQDEDTWENNKTEDSTVFCEWAKAYQIECQEKRRVDSITFIEPLSQAILQNKIQLPREITLIEFEDLSPQLTSFFEIVRSMGTKVHFASLLAERGNRNNIYRFAAEDSEEELRCAALYAKNCLLKNSESYIGIVVPDLEKKRSQVERIFAEVISKEIFNVSAPLPLSNTPIIKAALLVGSLLSGKASLEKWSQFLRSFFFGNAVNEANLHAMLDVELRKLGEAEFTLHNFVRKCKFIMQKKPKIACPSFLAQIEKLLRLQSKTKNKKKSGDWKPIFSKGLEILAWPGERSLTETEKTIYFQWITLLKEYAKMDAIFPEHSFAEAVSHLSRIAQETSIGLPIIPNVQIHVLGMLEALGMPFDYLWISGMHREAWPLEPAPNPFIPLKLQRLKEVPRSSPDRELKMAKRFTDKFCQGGKEVIFSYPKMIEEQPSSMSALIAPFKAVTQQSLGLEPIKSYLQQIGKVRDPSDSTAEVTDTLASPLLQDEKIRGGTRVLKLQALCPFRAFAEARLNAEPLPTTSKGLTPIERGMILHQILQNFWQTMTTQAELLALSEEALREKINEIIETVFQEWQTSQPTFLTPRYLAIEKARNFDLVYQWMTVEKTRSPFEVIANEQSAVVELQGLSFKIRIDRIDRLENQDEILIDYKTGEVSLSHWFGERPKDPQMPFYCVTRNPKPSGVAFAMLRKGSVKFTGLTATEKTLPGVKSMMAVKSLGAEASFSEQCDRWQNSLDSLTSEFKAGIATVAPLEGAQTCRTCSLQTLCRVAAVN